MLNHITFTQVNNDLTEREILPSNATLEERLEFQYKLYAGKAWDKDLPVSYLDKMYPGLKEHGSQFEHLEDFIDYLKSLLQDKKLLKRHDSFSDFRLNEMPDRRLAGYAEKTIGAGVDHIKDVGFDPLQWAFDTFELDAFSPFAQMDYLILDFLVAMAQIYYAIAQMPFTNKQGPGWGWVMSAQKIHTLVSPFIDLANQLKDEGFSRTLPTFIARLEEIIRLR